MKESVGEYSEYILNWDGMLYIVKDWSDERSVISTHTLDRLSLSPFIVVLHSIYMAVTFYFHVHCTVAVEGEGGTLLYMYSVCIWGYNCVQCKFTF